MRILHLLKHGVRGNGHVHVAVDLACQQAAAGHAVAFVSSGGSYDDLLRDHGVAVEVIPESGGVLGTARCTAGLLRAAGRFRPDVVHAHMMSSAVLGYGVAKLLGATLVTTMHNSFEPHSVLMRLGRVVVAVSEAERRLLLSRGYPARKVVTVVNGADGSPRETLPVDELGPLARPTIVTLSGLHPRKAVGDVISAFAEVLPEFPEWHLNVIGWGPDRERLERQVADLGVQRSVHFLGSTPTPRPLLEAADIFASASLADPCPLSVAEARAAGCAVVATAVGGVPEILDDGRAGQLVPPSDPAAMAAALRPLMADPTVLDEWRARSRHGAEHFTVARMAADYDRVYTAVRAGRRTAGRAPRPTPGAGPRRTRVAYFVPPSQHFAGIERVVHEVASGLAETAGDTLDVHVVYASRYDEDLLADPPYTLHVLDRDRLRHLAGSLRSLVAEQRFDVVVCPQVEASVVAWLATRGLGLPLFLTHLHGNPQVEEHQGTRRTRVAFALFRHLVSRRIAGVLAVSPSLGRYAARTVARHAPVHVVPNPVRDLGVATGGAEPGPGTFRFLSVGRLSVQKGQDLLLEALAAARPDLPTVSLTLVGSGPEESRLRRRADELGVADLVRFAGYTSDPAEHFGSADCFVLPSRWEGFGVVLVEALQFGLPLLAADCDFGPADVITDPRIGELVPPEDVSALAAGLRRAAARPTDSGADGFRRAAACRYDRRTAATEHHRVLTELLGSGPPHRVAASAR